MRLSDGRRLFNTEFVPNGTEESYFQNLLQHIYPLLYLIDLTELLRFNGNDVLVFGFGFERES